MGQAWKQFSSSSWPVLVVLGRLFRFTVAACVANRTLVCETTELCSCDLLPWETAISPHSGGIALETWTPGESGSMLPCNP